MPVLSSTPSAVVPYTYAQLRAQLRAELRTDPNGKIWSDLTLLGYINTAYLKIQRDGLFRWPGIEKNTSTITLVSGTEEYDLPSNFGVARLVMFGTTQLDKTTFEDVKIMNATNTQADPSAYYIEGDSIGFYPIPNGGTVTLYYREILTPFVEDSDVLGLGNNFALAIIKYASYLCWSDVRGNEAVANQKLKDYSLQLSILKTAYLFRDTANLNYRVQRNIRNHNYSDRLYE